MKHKGVAAYGPNFSGSSGNKTESGGAMHSVYPREQVECCVVVV